MGHFENSVPQAGLPMYLRPAGQFTTTAPDMAKLMALMLNNGELQGTPFINPELMRWLAYPNKTHASTIGLRIGHGLALAVRDRHGVIGMCHPGTTIGFRAYFCLFPEDGKGFFYAINTDSETANYEQFNALFIGALSIAEAPVEQPGSQVMDIEELAGLYLPSPNNMAEFEWLDLVFNFIWLRVDNGRLLVSSLQQDTRELLPLNQALLRATDRSRASHGIVVDEKGDTLFTTGLGTFRKTSPFRIGAYWISLGSGLLGLLYILCFGLLRILNRDVNKSKVLALPVACILGFSIPVYFFLHQPFFEFGDKNAASVSLAVITGLLPLALLVSILYWFKARKNTSSVSDIAALFMSLQLCLVLFYWDLMPLVFWR